MAAFTNDLLLLPRSGRSFAAGDYGGGISAVQLRISGSSPLLRFNLPATMRFHISLDYLSH